MSILLLIVVGIVMIMLAGLAGCVSDTSSRVVFPGKQWGDATPESQGLDPAKLAQAVEHIRTVSGKAGVDEMMVIRNGYIVDRGKQIDRVQPIYSCTKSFASTCFGLLWDDVKISPWDKISTYLPAMKKDYPELTIEQILTLTSGYKGQKDDFLKPGKPSFTPGTKFEYDRFAVLVTKACTQQAKMSMRDLFLQRIGKPIGIDPEQFRWGTVGENKDGLVINGGGGMMPYGISTSPEMLARFGWLYCNLGQWDGKQLISRRYVDYATAPRTSKDLPPLHHGRFDDQLPGNYGLHWWTNGPRPNGTPHWPSAPTYTFAAQGNRNSLCFVVPEWKMVIVRLGGDKVIPMTDWDPMFKMLAEALEEASGPVGGDDVESLPQ